MKSDALLAEASKKGDNEESIESGELFLLRQIATAASDLFLALRDENFRKIYPVEEMQEQLREAENAYSEWIC